MQIRGSVPFSRQIRQSANILAQIRKVSVNATVTREESNMLDHSTIPITVSHLSLNQLFRKEK